MQCEINCCCPACCSFGSRYRLRGPVAEVKENGLDIRDLKKWGKRVLETKYHSAVLYCHFLSVDVDTDSQRSCTIHPVIVGTLSNWCKNPSCSLVFWWQLVDDPQGFLLQLQAFIIRTSLPYRRFGSKILLRSKILLCQLCTGCYFLVM